jgi:hypothetical protein
VPRKLGPNLASLSNPAARARARPAREMRVLDL